MKEFFMSLAIPIAMCQTKYGFAIVSQYYLCLLSDLTKYGFVINFTILLVSIVRSTNETN